MLSKKICLIGDFGVGKTSLTRRFILNDFKDKYITTVGVKVNTKIITLTPEQSIKLIIFDIAGSEKFTSVKDTYIQGASGYLLVADGTRAATLETALELQQQMESQNHILPFVGLLNKNDLVDDWEVSQDFINQQKGDWLTTSALSGENVEKAFHLLAKKCWNSHDK